MHSHKLIATQELMEDDFDQKMNVYEKVVNILGNRMIETEHVSFLMSVF